MFDNQGGRSAEKKDARLDAMKENAANISNISAIMFDSSFNNSKLDLGELLHDLVSHDNRDRNFNKTQKRNVVVQKQKTNENEKLTSRGSLKMTKEELHGSLSPRIAYESVEREKYQKGKPTGGSDTARYHTQKEFKTYLQSNYESESRKILSHRDPIEYKSDRRSENYFSRDSHAGNKKNQASLEKR